MKPQESKSPRKRPSMFGLEQFPDLPTHYTISSLLGEGAFSSVYKGLNKNTGEDVAIKIINKMNLSSRQISNIQNEISVMNTLTVSGGHTNILKLIEYFDTADYCYLVLEYCDGGEIFNKIIEYTYFSEDLARHVFLQLLDAVRFMHEHNVVHRDIKPENLLFKSIPIVERSSEDFKASLRASDDSSKADEGVFRTGIGGGGIGTIKLADFGLAKQLKYDPAASSGRASSNLKTPCGTAGYTAPEVIHCGVDRKRRFKSATSKSNFYSKAVDIWSLGCFLYTSLCGFPPFYDEDNEVLTRKILTADYVFLEPWWDEISDNAKDLISRMLVVSAKTRITIDEIYNHPWMANTTALKTGSYFPDHSLSTSLSALSFNQNKKTTSPFGSASGLASPEIAIRSVFNNPAMSHVSLKSLAQISKDKNAGVVHFKEVSFDYKNKPKDRSKSHIPRTPNPIHKVDFGDVFRRHGLSFGSDVDTDDEDDESQDPDNLGDSDESYTISEDEEISNSSEESSLVGDVLEFGENSSVTAFHIRNELHDEHKTLKNLSISSNSSMDSSKSTNNGDEYVTRSSSVISGVNGDFKFTLNMNDSNLLRRRSSTKSGRA